MKICVLLLERVYREFGEGQKLGVEYGSNIYTEKMKKSIQRC
jgi:hypothetical protein